MSEIKTEIKLSSKSKSKSKISNNLLNRLKTIILNLKSFLSGILKTSIALYNAQLKIMLMFAISILNLKLLDEKYQSISVSDSKGNGIKIPAEKSKKYILLFLNICNSLLVFANKNDQLAYKVLVFFIIKQFIIFFVNIKELAVLKSYIINIYSNDKFMISNLINKLNFENLYNISLIELIGFFYVTKNSK